MATQESKTRCRFCGSLADEPCKGVGKVSVGRCRWVGLLKAMCEAKKELTSGRFVDRSIRGQEVIDKALERYSDE